MAGERSSPSVCPGRERVADGLRGRVLGALVEGHLVSLLRRSHAP
ncbi:hypothetical protein ACFFX0_32175 [Citricoccus parietis]|uniref:Uncharacterized protein n=1 Tax=Citricoccus parietis TaxID=592307 RepID=A0ABV5G9G8_9MICC